jgi:uncharacterized protein (DUF2237 family)
VLIALGVIVMHILSRMNKADFNDLSNASENYKVTGPEDQLEEIIIVAYETALDAGLKPAQALAVVEAWAASERLRLADHTESSTLERDPLTGFLRAA